VPLPIAIPLSLLWLRRAPAQQSPAAANVPALHDGQ
jgi:hypothetical protein